MSLRVSELRDAKEALDRAGAFLATRPVDHNLLLTILDQSIELSRGGAFWVVEDDSGVIGFALQSPPGFGAVATPMPVDAVRALADTIDAPLPGFIAVAEVAAAFAGRFAERHHLPARTESAGRLYELTDLRMVATAPGVLRVPTAADRGTLIQWTRAFAVEGAPAGRQPPAEEVVDLAVARGGIWIWDDDGPVSMTGASKPKAGVARVQRVYTPPERRGAGYATACTEHVSRTLTDRGVRCILYTDLANPTSNAIYRSIGYDAIAEVVGYAFG